MAESRIARQLPQRASSNEHDHNQSWQPDLLQGLRNGTAGGNIDHTGIKVKSPQTHGIVERFHRPCSTILSGRLSARDFYRSLDKLPVDLDR